MYNNNKFILFFNLKKKEAFLPPPEGLIRKDSEIFDGAVTWEREELTHVMDLDVDPSRGLLVAALNADPDAPEGAAIVCPAPMEDARYDAPVDGAYFQRWVVGDDCLCVCVCVCVCECVCV